MAGEKGADTLLEVVPEFSRFEHASVGTLYMLFGIGGVVTNLLLILTLLKDKTLLRGTSSWLHISLALANIGVVAPAPFPASSSFSGKWLYGDGICQAYAFEGMFMGIAAIGSVICLCIERYLVSSKKEAMQQSLTTFYWVSTILNVTNALFWAMMPLLGWSRYSLDHTGTTCAIDWKNPDESYSSYMSMLCIFSFGFPMMLAVICLYASFPSSATSGQAAPVVQGEREGSTTTMTEEQLRWLCVFFVILVLIGWGPFAWLCLWALFGDTVGVSMLAACIPPLTCKCFTMLYPLTYNIVNPRLRAGYLSILGAGAEETAKLE